MLMGDCLALLQDGNFLAQLFWFRVPGGGNQGQARLEASLHFYLTASSNWFSRPEPTVVVLLVLLGWVTHVMLS